MIQQLPNHEIKNKNHVLSDISVTFCNKHTGSGIFPEGIKDPVMRAKYQKMLDDNNALGEAQMKYDTLSRMQNDIAEYFSAFVEIKSENLKIASEEINRIAQKPEAAKELTDLIGQKSFEKHRELPVWPND